MHLVYIFMCICYRGCYSICQYGCEKQIRVIIATKKKTKRYYLYNFIVCYMKFCPVGELVIKYLYYFLFTRTMSTSVPYSLRMTFLAATGVLALTGTILFSSRCSTSTRKHFAPHFI